MVSQRIVAHEFGPPLEVLRLESTPPLGAGMSSSGMRSAEMEIATVETAAVETAAVETAVVRMLASPINPSDLIPATGAYRSRTDLPFVPGFEGVGIVEAVTGSRTAGQLAPTASADSSVEDRHVTGHPLIGKRVIPIGSAGGWQTHKTCDTSWCFEVPNDISDADAAMAYVNPLTAIRMVDTHVDGNKTEASTRGVRDVRVAVVSAAGSSIAQVLRYLLAERGVRTIGLQRAERPLRRHDVSQWDAMITTSEPDWQHQLRDAVRTLGGGSGSCSGDKNNSSPDVVFDSVGGPLGTYLAKQLRPGGTLVHFGLLSGQPISTDLWDTRPDLTVDLFHLRNWVHHTERENIAAAFDTAFQLIRDGVIRTPVQAEFPLPEFAEAIRLSTDNAANGKVLLRP